MKEWPADPMRQHNRFIAAMCDDWIETGVLSLDGPKAARVVEINRQTRKAVEQLRNERNHREARAAEQAPGDNS